MKLTRTRKISRAISNYMWYLLVHCPHMLATVKRSMNACAKEIIYLVSVTLGKTFSLAFAEGKLSNLRLVGPIFCQATRYDGRPAEEWTERLKEEIEQSLVDSCELVHMLANSIAAEKRS